MIDPAKCVLRDAGLENERKNAQIQAIVKRDLWRRVAEVYAAKQRERERALIADKPLGGVA